MSGSGKSFKEATSDEETAVARLQGGELGRLVQLFLHGAPHQPKKTGARSDWTPRAEEPPALALLAEITAKGQQEPCEALLVYDLEVVQHQIFWRAWRTRPHKRDRHRLIQGEVVSWEERHGLNGIDLTAADLLGLALAGSTSSYATTGIPPIWRAAALKAIVESGRAFWGDHTYGMALCWSKEQPLLGWQWRQDAKGRFVGAYSFPESVAGCQLITNTQPWHYLSVRQRCVGAFALPEGIEWEQFVALQRLPPIAPAEIDRFARLWQERMPAYFPAPQPVAEVEVPDPPRYVVRLFRDSSGVRWVEPAVEYGPVLCFADGEITHPLGEAVVRIRGRNRRREEEWFSAVALFWGERALGALPRAFAPSLTAAQWWQKRAEISEALAAFHPELVAEEGFWPKAESAYLESLSLTPIAEQPDWFEWRGEVRLTDRVTVPVETIAAELFSRYGGRAWPEELVVDVPGQADCCAVVPLAPLEPVLRVALELLVREPKRRGPTRVSRYDVALLETIPEALWPARPPAFAAMLDELRAHGGPLPAVLPATLRADLRPYQRDGVAWLQFWRRHRLHGLLADDMGLGKTLQALAHLEAERVGGRLHQPALVVAPTSLIGNWLREAARFTPELRALAWHGPCRQGRVEELAGYDLLVTSYALLWRDIALLREVPWSVVILDEAQAIKNPRAKVALCARQLRADQRLCLTGTPMENHLGELWAIFDFLLPGFLGSHEVFQRAYRTPIEKQGDNDRLAFLRQRIRPFFLRRTKEEVAKELPAKSEIVATLTLGERQAKVYEAIRVAMEARVRQALAEKGLAKSQITVLDALLKLRQVCCHPALVDSEHARRVQESAKLDWLREMLPELVSEGRRVLLFSQFVQWLRKVEALLGELALPYVLLTGETKERDAVVARFQSGAVPLFLLSLKAGGTGLNLTAADTVILLDPWWNPAVEEQAIDRAHRIGQDKPVFIYKLICANTVEEQIVRLQEQKRTLVSATVAGGGATGLALSEQEVTALFAVTPVAEALSGGQRSGRSPDQKPSLQPERAAAATTARHGE